MTSDRRPPPPPRTEPSPGGDEGPRLGAGAEFDRIRRILAMAGVGGNPPGSEPTGGGPPVNPGSRRPGGAPPPASGSGSSGGPPPPTPASGARPAVLVGPGDDAAVLASPEGGGVVLSTDMAVEGVHFRLDWITAREAGHRAAAAALSDLAAMAATPLGLLASVAAPGEGEMAEDLMAGVTEAARAAGAPLLGGDLTRSPGPAVVDVIVVGWTAHPLLRTGARPGDRLWVTGRLGGAAAALRAWTEGGEPDPRARQAFVRPLPRIPQALWLQAHGGARAGLDLSDGLAGDAGHLAAASGVGVVLEADALRQIAFGGPETRDPTPDPGLSEVLHGGEDYELLVALPPSFEGSGVEEFTERFDLSLSPVGWVVEGEGVWLRAEPGDAPKRLTRGGWDHFAPSPASPPDPPPRTPDPASDAAQGLSG